MSDAISRVASLPFWSGPIDPLPLAGGITNTNFTVVDGARKYVVRVGDDIPVHQVMRFNERAASKAAHTAGLSPEVVYTEPGILVLSFIEGKTLGEDDVRSQAMLARILKLVVRCHRDVPKHLRGPALIFWVFHVLRDYGHTLKAGDSRHGASLARFTDITQRLEAAVGPVEIVFGHNDLLCGNFIDDGDRLWLIDWDYAGFNSPLFDLANLASNNNLNNEQEQWLLETYFASPVSDARWRGYLAMKCASLLRETMWSMVSELHSRLDFDYAAYTAENLERFESAWRDFNNLDRNSNV